MPLAVKFCATISVRHNPTGEVLAADATLASAGGVSEVEKEGDTIIVVPAVDLTTGNFTNVGSCVKGRMRVVLRAEEASRVS